MSSNRILAIAHRVCPALSQTAVGFSSKEKMVKATTNSLASALGQFKGQVRLFVILDGCPEWRTIFESEVADCTNVSMSFTDTPAIGNFATYSKQVEILLAEKDADYLYFSEDDYLYRPDAFLAMADMLERDGVDFVTPLDHPDRYNHALGNKGMPRATEMRVSPYCHWRTVENSCMTYMTSRKVFDEAKDIIVVYGKGAMDGTMWAGLTKYDVFRPSVIVPAALAYALRLKRPFIFYMPLCAWKHCGLNLIKTRRFSLWQPVPTLAVHLSNLSLPLHSEEFFAKDDIETQRLIRDTSLKYLEIGGDCR